MFTNLLHPIARSTLTGVVLVLAACGSPATAETPRPTMQTKVRPTVPVTRPSSGDSSKPLDWTSTLPDGSALRAAAIDREGDLILAVTMGSEDRLAGHLLPQGLSLVTLKPGGKLRWQLHLSKSREAIIRDIALKDDGSYLVAGTFAATLAVNDLRVSSKGDRDAFVAQISQDGKTRWLRSLGGIAREEATSIAISEEAGLVTIGGWSESSFRFGGKDYSARGTAMDGFIATFDLSGTPKWAERYQGVGIDEVHDLAYERDALCVLGSFSTALRMGTKQRQSQGQRDIFVIRYDARGAREWTKTWGSNKADYGVALHADTDGALHVLGLAGGDLQMGGSVSKALGASDLLLWKLSSSGDVVASQRHGGKGRFVALHAESEGMLLSGYYQGQGALSHLQLPETAEERALQVEIGPELELVSAQALDYDRLLFSRRRFGTELHVGLSSNQVKIDYHAIDDK